jgi:hypothetical protein
MLLKSLKMKNLMINSIEEANRIPREANITADSSRMIRNLRRKKRKKKKKRRRKKRRSPKRKSPKKMSLKKMSLKRRKRASNNFNKKAQKAPSRRYPYPYQRNQ